MTETEQHGGEVNRDGNTSSPQRSPTTSIACMVMAVSGAVAGVLIQGSMGLQFASLGLYAGATVLLVTALIAYPWGGSE